MFGREKKEKKLKGEGFKEKEKEMENLKMMEGSEINLKLKIIK